MKKILTFQDYSCLGRCSLTVALPTISACGVECVGIPTSVFSNHTAFPSWIQHDLTSEVEAMVRKIEEYSPFFDMVYTGYLTTDQIPTVLPLIQEFKKRGSLVFVDPAMADGGHLYAGFKEGHVKAMKELVKEADILKPNLTEACLLTGVPYPSKDTELPLSFYQKLIDALFLLGPKRIILSGQELQKGMMSEVIYDGATRVLKGTKRYPGSFHGTGDLFSSSFAGAFLNGKSFGEAVNIAHQYVSKAISITSERGGDGQRFGVDFEQAIPYLVSLFSK